MSLIYVDDACISYMSQDCVSPSNTIPVNNKQIHDATRHLSCVSMCLALTHPNLSKAALAQFELQSQGLPGNLPGIFSETLGLRLDSGANCGQPVAKPIGMLCNSETQRSKCYIIVPQTDECVSCQIGSLCCAKYRHLFKADLDLPVCFMHRFISFDAGEFRHSYTNCHEI